MLAGGTVQELMGVTIHEMVELGIDQKYNTLFDTAAGSTAYTTPAAGGSATFTGSSEELVIGVDATRDFAWRALEVDPEAKSTFSLEVDNQWLYNRGRKVIGYYGSLTEGRVITSNRALHGLIV